MCPGKGKNRIPTLSRDNYEIWNLFLLMLPGLQRTDGYDYNAIGFVFNTYDIEQERRAEMFDSIKKLIGVVSAEKEERRGNAN